MTPAGRLLIVANRLPVTIRTEADDLVVEPSIGGVATGLAKLHQERGGLWFGWSGIVPTDAQMADRLDAKLADLGCIPLRLSATEVAEFYQQTCNAVIWPLFHYLTERLPLEMGAFDAYREVNRRMAELVVASYRPGDTIWIHDYHFLLLPALIRDRLPNARIGFFLHIPFPSSEIFRLLPERETILDGLLGADLIGFHTAAYLRHFANALLVVNGIPAVADRIRMAGREVRLGVFPMGVDVDHFERLARTPETAEAVATTREGGGQILLAIDRLDYTKGVPRRLLAFEQLLIRHPELVGKVRLLNLAAPSREMVEAYREHREGVDAVVGRINGRFGTATWVPVHYMYRSVSHAEVVGLYRSADVMLVTPLRDGMNLVAKEYVASRTDDDGVLVMSEFAGAAAELGEATLVNPYDVIGTADAIYEALTMVAPERQRRIRAMRARVRGGDIHRWTAGFLESLDQGPIDAVGSSIAPKTLVVATERALKSDRLVLLLDYDGTLVPLDPAPERALPDQPLLDLLGRLATRKRTQVHIVSGRSSGFLDRWLGNLPIHLHGEFGGWYRDPEERVWQRTVSSSTGWQELVRPILTEFSRVTPGAAVEFKRECLAWHWRRAEPRFGRRQARELALHLTQLLANEPVEVLFGSQVLEVRPQGMHKGKALSRVANGRPSKTLMVAIGDEPGDDDLFRALPDDSIRIRVGPGPTLAPIRIGSVGEVRSFLLGLVGN
jgi:trehalose 6-phosphate synthase/phosphatase